MVNMVNLPERNSVQLTIYNSADLTLVKETRALTLRKGLNRLEFSWANTLIDPTSIEFRALTHAEAVDVVDVSYPPRVSNMLEWRIQSEISGEVLVEIRYFTSGITWSADYVAEAAAKEDNLRLAGYVRVTNRSGEDYENAQVRLVVGIVRLVQPIAQIAQQWQQGNHADAAGCAASRTPACRRELKETGAPGAGSQGWRARTSWRKSPKRSCRNITSIPWTRGTRSRTAGASDCLRSMSRKCRLASYYKFEKEAWGDQVMRFYRFTNSVASSLGKEPLPDGAVQAFRQTGTDDALDYVGGTSVKYIPINENVELDLGRRSGGAGAPGADELGQEGPGIRPERPCQRLDHGGDVGGGGAELPGHPRHGGCAPQPGGRLVAWKPQAAYEKVDPQQNQVPAARWRRAASRSSPTRSPPATGPT